ncbi:hypothetical protein HYC85_031597 [Camellia sinensis]|uniref:LOB domain-containing protein n=1 Tax=Camellia sinensis TaxID=4442 RepID=A0A7J7FUV5_CAMSI|nr:hypothetical protein HYC85_031597 [Camellia sinensis]
MSRERERFEEIGKKIKREISDVTCSSDHNNNQMGRRHILGGPPQGTILNTITPCAACKLLRRRCAEECPFSPYFSPHEPHKFAAVHKVFGASNVSKMLMEVPESQRADAANSLVYEANVRLRDPVYGCMGAISALQQQLESLQAELNSVRAEIFRYKYTEAATNIIAASSNHASLISSAAVSDSLLPPPVMMAPSPPPPPPLPPPPPPSVFVSSSASSLYTLPGRARATMGYNSIPSDRVLYFD